MDGHAHTHAGTASRSYVVGFKPAEESITFTSVITRLRSWWVVTSHRAIITDPIARILESLSGTVVDIGGGRSAPHDHAWPRETRRVRLDIVPAGAPDVVGDATRLPIRTNSVDAVVAFETLEHLADPTIAAAEVHRILKPGASFHGTAPFVYPVHGDPHDFYRFTDDGLRRVLGPFKDVTIRPFGNHWSAAWTLLTTESRLIRILSPLLRRWPWRANPRSPEGYAFSATKASDDT